MGEAAESFAVHLTRRGYACYPTTVRLDDRGNKRFLFPLAGGRMVGWGEGDYPTDEDAIVRHWQGFDGLIINTGRSGLVVVDIDTKKGKDGFTGLKESGVELPYTPLRVGTPSGGLHAYYREGDIPVALSQGKLAEGVDIRARGGIVVAPPTVVEGGGAYEFLTGAPQPVSELPVFPDDLARRLQPTERTIELTDERPALTLEQRARMERTLDRVIRGLSLMEDGTRYATMSRLLLRAFGLGKSLGEAPESVAALVRRAYYDSGGVDDHQLEASIKWAQTEARCEQPREEDYGFEAEVARLLRMEKAKAEVKSRLSPIKAKAISDDDVLTFRPTDVANDYWIDGILPKGETVILFGTPNAGKSFAAIDLALGAATGSRAWGKDVRPARVLYLAGEGTRRLALRAKAWEALRQKSPEAGRLQLRRMRLLLASDESVAQYRELVSEMRVDIIIVDTFIRAAEGLDTTQSPGDTARAIAQLDRLREAHPGATVVVLHHPAKSNPDEPAGPYPIKGNVDTIIRLDDVGGTRWMGLTKSKEGDTSWRSAFELRDVEIPGSNLGSAVLVPRGFGGPFDDREEK